MKILLTLLAVSILVPATASAIAVAYFAPGSYQGWTLPQDAPELLDDGTGGDLVAWDGIYSVMVVITDPGTYEWKAAEADWMSSWPGSGNCWFITTESDEDVLLTFDINSQGDGWAPDDFWPMSDHTFGGNYKVVGDLQDEMGDTGDWDAAGGGLYLHDDGLDGDAEAGDGYYAYMGNLDVPGTYVWKVAVNDGWAQQFGTDGPSVNASTWTVEVEGPSKGPIWFVLDLNLGRIFSSFMEPVSDDDASWGELKRLYR